MKINKLLLYIIIGMFAIIPLVSGALTDNIIAYYDFDEATTDLEDIVDGFHNGTEFQGSTIVKSLEGIVGNSWNFTGGSYLNMTDAWEVVVNPSDNPNFTYSVWVNTDFAGAFNKVILSTFQSPTTNSRVFSDGEQNPTGEIETDTVEQTSHILNGQGWQFIVFVGNTTDLILYMNGTEVVNDDSLTTSTFTCTTCVSTIGGNIESATGVNNFTGRIDEVGIWNRSLSPAEITELYNGGAGFNPFASSITTTLNTPLNNGTSVSSGIDFNATIAVTGSNITNATIFVWYNNGTVFNETFIILTGNVSNESIFNITGFRLGGFHWNVFANSINHSGDTLTSFASSNFTFDFGYRFNNQNFSNPVASLSSQIFTLNTTLISGLAVQTGTLIYNNTEFTSIRTTVDGDSIFTSTIDVPRVSADINISFNWNLTLNDGLGNQLFQVVNSSQQVNALSIDDCTVNTRVVLNYTIFDEGSLLKLISTDENTTGEVELTFSSISNNALAGNFSQNYSKINSFAVCVAQDTFESSSFRMDVITSYKADDYVKEFHNIQNFTIQNSTQTQNISLFDLKTTDSQEFLINFKDSSFLPVQDALIDITRKYIGDGVFRSVEIPKTDNDGNTLGHFVLSDEIYTIIVTKEGQTLGTFANIKAVCENQATGDCKINLRQVGATIQPFNFDEEHNVQYTLTFNETSRVVESIFTNLDGSSTTMLLNVTKFDNFGNETVCFQSLTTSAGTLSCTVPASLGNLTLVAELSVDGDLIARAFFTIQDDPFDVFGDTRIILALIFVITLPLMFLTSGSVAVIMGIVGVGAVMLFNIISKGTFLGVGSTLLWLAIAGGILLWKISRRT